MTAPSAPARPGELEIAVALPWGDWDIVLAALVMAEHASGLDKAAYAGMRATLEDIIDTALDHGLAAREEGAR